MVSKIGQRKFLLKHGYFEGELDKMSPSEAKRIIASIEKIEHPQGQRKVYSEKEINAIKEFVEWYKKVLEQDYDDKGTRAIVNMVHELENDYWFYHGQCEAIQRLRSLLDSDLEKFLEERK